MSGQKQMFTLRLEPALHRALNACAGIRGVSLNDLLVDLIDDSWKKAPEYESITAAQRAAATPVATKGEQSTPKEAAKEEASSPKAKPSKPGANAKKS
jgi:HicB family